MTHIERLIKTMAELIAEESIRHRGDTFARRNLLVVLAEFEEQAGARDDCRHSHSSGIAPMTRWCPACGALGTVTPVGTTWRKPGIIG